MKYFAYGSNMLKRRLTHPSRAPSAVFLQAARLPGHLMVFHKHGMDGSGKCTLSRSDHASDIVCGALFDVRDDEVMSLDTAEDFLRQGYYRTEVSVCDMDNAHCIEAETYLASEEFIDPSLKPFDWYKALVIAGALEHGLPREYVAELRRVEAIVDPDADRREQGFRLVSHA